MTTDPTTARGTVREWHDEEGWGVIDSPRTPGGCWVLWSAVATTTGDLRPGQDVAFTHERADQDGYRHRARRAWPWGGHPVERPGTTVFDDRGGAFRSTLTLTWDDPAAAGAAAAPPAGTPHPPPPSAPVLGTVTVTVVETAPGRNEVRVHTLGTLTEHLVETAVAELQRVRRQLPD